MTKGGRIVITGRIDEVKTMPNGKKAYGVASSVKGGAPEGEMEAIAAAIMSSIIRCALDDETGAFARGVSIGIKRMTEPERKALKDIF